MVIGLNVKVHISLEILRIGVYPIIFSYKLFSGINIKIILGFG